MRLVLFNYFMLSVITDHLFLFIHLLYTYMGKQHEILLEVNVQSDMLNYTNHLVAYINN